MRGTNKLDVPHTTAATDCPSLPNFGVSIYEPASYNSVKAHVGTRSSLDSTSSLTSGCNLPAKLSAESSFAKYVLDDNSRNWRQTVSAAFRLIDRQGRGTINAELLLQAMNDFELVRSILPDFSQESHRRLAEVRAFIRFVGGGDVVSEAAWTSRLCIDIPLHKQLLKPARFNATAFGQTSAFILDLDGSSRLAMKCSKIESAVIRYDIPAWRADRGRGRILRRLTCTAATLRLSFKYRLKVARRHAAQAYDTAIQNRRRARPNRPHYDGGRRPS